MKINNLKLKGRKISLKGSTENSKGDLNNDSMNPNRKKGKK